MFWFLVVVQVDTSVSIMDFLDTFLTVVITGDATTFTDGIGDEFFKVEIADSFVTGVILSFVDSELVDT